MIRRAATVAFGGFMALSAGYAVFSLLRPSLGEGWAATAAALTLAAAVLFIDRR